MGISSSSTNEKPAQENNSKLEESTCNIADKSAAAGEPKKLKPCCACPETKKARDTW